MIPMPDAIVWRLDKIGAKQKQGRILLFANRNKEDFPWEDEIIEDDSEFQGLLEEESPFPDISAKLPGVHLKSDKPTAVVQDVAKPTDGEQADTAHRNADIHRTEIDGHSIGRHVL